MTISTAVKIVAQPSSTGSQVAISGLAFQPQIAFFTISHLTADGSATTHNIGFGVGVSSSDRRSSSWYDQDALASSECGWRRDNSKCIHLMNDAGTVVFAADVVSMDSGGLTWNVTTTDGTARKIAVELWGGLSNVATFQFQKNTSTGNQSISSLGFQPEGYGLWDTRSNATAPPNQFTANTVWLFLGVASAGGQWVQANLLQSGQAVANVMRRQLTTDVLLHLDASGGNTNKGSHVSMDTNGFTYNLSVTDAVAAYIFGFAFRTSGGSVGVGSFDQPTSNGVQTVSLGFQAAGALFGSWGKVAGTTGQNDAHFMLGLASAPTERGVVVGVGLDAADPTDTDTVLDTAKAIKVIAASTLATQAAADYNAPTSTALQIDWTTTDATQRQVVYLAVGDVAAGGVQSRLPLLGVG